MNILGLVAWCAIAFVLIIDILFYSFFTSVDGSISRGSFLILGILCMLPMIPMLANHVQSEFIARPFFGLPVIVGMVVSFFSGVLCFFLFDISILSAALFAFLFASLFLRIGGQVAFSFALIMLILVPICLISGYNTEAETLSIYVYYFLVIGVLSELAVPKSINNQENEAC